MQFDSPSDNVVEGVAIGIVLPSARAAFPQPSGGRPLDREAQLIRPPCQSTPGTQRGCYFGTCGFIAGPRQAGYLSSAVCTGTIRAVQCGTGCLMDNWTDLGMLDAGVGILRYIREPIQPFLDRTIMEIRRSSLKFTLSSCLAGRLAILVWSIRDRDAGKYSRTIWRRRCP